MTHAEYLYMNLRGHRDYCRMMAAQSARGAQINGFLTAVMALAGVLSENPYMAIAIVIWLACFLAELGLAKRWRRIAGEADAAMDRLRPHVTLPEGT